jgi:hypothetical protein
MCSAPGHERLRAPPGWCTRGQGCQRSEPAQNLLASAPLHPVSQQAISVSQGAGQNVTRQAASQPPTHLAGTSSSSSRAAECSYRLPFTVLKEPTQQQRQRQRQQQQQQQQQQQRAVAATDHVMPMLARRTVLIQQESRPRLQIMTAAGYGTDRHARGGLRPVLDASTALRLGVLHSSACGPSRRELSAAWPRSRWHW